LDCFEKQLGEIRKAIETDDADKLTETFAKSKKIRDNFLR